MSWRRVRNHIWLRGSHLAVSGCAVQDLGYHYLSNTALAFNSLISWFMFCTDDSHAREALALVLADLGTWLKTSGSTSEALERYQQAVQVCPSCAAGHYNLGVITSEAKQVCVSLGSLRGI